MAHHDLPGTLKRVLLNGIEIGSYASTGDIERDIAIARQVLIDKGVYKAVSRQQAMYNQAFAFCSAASDLFAKHLVKSPFNGHAIAPFIVNAAFSIELFLKTLHFQNGETVRGHRLSTLYERLSKRVRERLDAVALKHAPEYGVSNPVSFSTCLNQLNDAFEKWRYLYESEAQASIQVQETIFVMRVLHEVCGEELNFKK